jgi:chemotaxis signal transduction protein
MRELFLTSFNGIQYGIWKDEILAVRDIYSLHRIPLCPSRIAGIMIEDGQTVTLADLPVCIGHVSTRGTEPGCILLMQVGDKFTGFVVSGELRTQAISPELVFPLPEYLKSPAFDSCAVHDNIPIPVIRIAELYAGMLKADDMLSSDSLRMPDIHPRVNPGISQVRFFAAGGEIFAVNAEGIVDRAVKPGPITPLPGTPLFVKGVTFKEGRLLPVIDLSQRINSQRVAPAPLMLIAGIGGAAFGMLIESDEGMLPADKVSIKPAPLIAQTSLLKHVVVRSGELIPLIDLAMALSPGKVVVDEKPIWQRYAPDSSFPEIFFRHEVEVMEFSLLGARYALPKQEVEDVIAFNACRALPDVPAIVIGMAEHNGEILPVVDPAMMFGRRSITTPDWRMLLVKNGDFRALVITETVFGERSLPMDIHRKVPIHLPHNLMYGCYPDEKAVRIILNVEAISVHFEKSLIQKFMPALSQEMRMSPTGTVYTFPEENAGMEEKVGEEPQPSSTKAPFETAAPFRAEAEPVPEAARESEPGKVEVVAASSTGTLESISTENGLSADSVLEPEPLASAEAVSEQAITIAPEAGNAESTAKKSMAEENVELASTSLQAVPEFKYQAEVEDVEFVEWEEEATTTPPFEEPGHIDADDASVSEILITPEANKAAEPAPKPTDQLHSATARQSSATGNKARKTAVTSNKSALETLKESVKTNHEQKISSEAPDDSRPKEPFRTAPGAKPGTPYRMSREVELLATLSGHEVRRDRALKRRIAFGAIAAVLFLAFYFAWTSDKTVVENSIQGTGLDKTEQAMAHPEQGKEESIPVRTRTEQAKEKTGQTQEDAQAEHEAKLKTEQEAKVNIQQTLVLSPMAKAQKESPRPAEISRPPLELDIPKNKPTDIDVYVVQEGDTLWSISERFTGNPFNYPRIAGENRIADPDLIFPEQRIRLIK